MVSTYILIYVAAFFIQLGQKPYQTSIGSYVYSSNIESKVFIPEVKIKIEQKPKIRISVIKPASPIIRDTVSNETISPSGEILP
jgi:hypothetical protein